MAATAQATTRRRAPARTLTVRRPLSAGDGPAAHPAGDAALPCGGRSRSWCWSRLHGDGLAPPPGDRYRYQLGGPVDAGAFEQQRELEVESPCCATARTWPSWRPSGLACAIRQGQVVDLRWPGPGAPPASSSGPLVVLFAFLVRAVDLTVPRGLTRASRHPPARQTIRSCRNAARSSIATGRSASSVNAVDLHAAPASRRPTGTLPAREGPRHPTAALRGCERTAKFVARVRAPQQAQAVAVLDIAGVGQVDEPPVLSARRARSARARLRERRLAGSPASSGVSTSRSAARRRRSRWRATRTGASSTRARSARRRSRARASS
jgi:hypothetical protein